MSAVQKLCEQLDVAKEERQIPDHKPTSADHHRFVLNLLIPLALANTIHCCSFSQNKVIACNFDNKSCVATAILLGVCFEDEPLSFIH